MATIKLQVPQDLDCISIDQYQRFDKILKANEGAEDTEFVNLKMLSIFCDCTMADLRKGSVDQYTKAVDILTETFKQTPDHRRIITVNGDKYGFIPNLDDITLGEYVDLDKYIREPADYHRAMAIMYRPITEEIRDTYNIEEYEGSEKYADVMKDASMADVLGAMVFFYHLANELLRATKDSLALELMTATPQADAPDSVANGDGINQSITSQAMMSLESVISLNYPYLRALLN
jgi:hypothetical protein